MFCIMIRLRTYLWTININYSQSFMTDHSSVYLAIGFDSIVKEGGGLCNTDINYVEIEKANEEFHYQMQNIN